MKISKSSKFFYSCLLFLIGVAIGEILDFKNIWFLIIAGFVLLLFLLIKKRLLAFFALIFIFGVFWNNLFDPNINDKHISFYNDQYKTFQAVISSEPDVRLNHQKLTVTPTEFNGKVLLSTTLYPEYEYGDLLEVNCKLQTPEPIEDFKYDRYLARYGIYSVCYQPQINLASFSNSGELGQARLNLKNQGSNPLIAGVLKIKKAVELKINRTVSEPQAALTAGILIGSRQGIPRALLDKFNITGITHIIAISGFNITIIVVVLMNLAKALYVNRKKAIWGILLGLIFFVILTGMSASVVRAAIMGMIVVFAKHIGRVGKIRNVLILSAVLMVLFNPKILIWDAGFQLSFVSTIGLVYLSPVLLKYFKWLPKKMAVQENLTSTLSAIIFTLPLILFNFHRLSIVAPLVNLLVLPIIPIAMLVGFIQVIFSFVNVFLGQFIGWFTWLLLTYIIKIVEIFSSFGWASVEMRIDWWLMVVLYALLLIAVNKKSKDKG